MKSKFLAVTLSAVALTACNNDEVMEVNRGRSIGFQVATDASTRMQATTTNTIDNFMVWGFTDSETLMDQVTVSKANGAWSYENTVFWPEGDVDFYSVSPSKDCGGTVAVSSTEQKITGFTVNAEQGKQVDLLYAVNKGESKDRHANAPVSVNFRHALSQIVFKAKNTNENLKVIVHGVKIANIKSKGDFTYPSNSTTATSRTIDSSTQGAWGALTDATTFSAGVTLLTLDGKVDDAKDLTTTSGGTYTGALFMIPQELTPWDPETTGALNASNTGVYFLLDCQMLTGANDDIQLWPKKGGETHAEVAIPASRLTWEQGKKYIYTFTFGDGGGYEPGTDPNPNPTLVGIDFTVTVDGFIDGTGEELDMEVDAGQNG